MVSHCRLRINTTKPTEIRAIPRIIKYASLNSITGIKSSFCVQIAAQKLWTEFSAEMLGQVLQIVMKIKTNPIKQSIIPNA